MRAELTRSFALLFVLVLLAGLLTSPETALADDSQLSFTL